jgi:MFS family permease
VGAAMGSAVARADRRRCGRARRPWPWIFWLNVLIGLTAAALTPRLLSESLGEQRSLDLIGVALVSAGLLALIWGMARGNESGWSSFEIAATLTVGAPLLVAFVSCELRARSPLLPRHLLADRCPWRRTSKACC